MNDLRDKPREFAVRVVTTLREAGFESLWAGGCVRDALLGIQPKDYDVATTATPEQVIEVFGKKKTVPVGVSFGVVMVLGPERACGQVEVATFRSDGEYLDGRRPASVQYCSAEEDAKRRDFTINGMFYDPIADEVIDYVGGRKDLQAGVLRAIGNADDRFAEDKLRMLRAVRFAATYQLDLDVRTAAAIKSQCTRLKQVSAERIAQELRRMLAHATRAVSVQKLFDVGLLSELFPGACATCGDVENLCHRLSFLRLERFETSLAAILSPLLVDAAMQRERVAGLAKECRKLKLSNDENHAVCWIADAGHACRNAADLPLRRLKPILADQRHAMLIDYMRADELGNGRSAVDADFLQRYVDQTATEVIDPPPFIDGADVKQLGIQPGPVFKQLLHRIREEQLDELITDRDAALEQLRRYAAQA